MLLVDQKANVLLSKIDFAERKIAAISSPDEILLPYINDLASWLGVLKDQVSIVQNEFREFTEQTSFSESDYLQDEAQRRLLKDLLRTYEEIETRIYLGVDTFLPLIPMWRHQREDRSTRKGHKLLVDFIHGLLQLSGIHEVMIAVLGEAHACLPLSWDPIIKHVVFATYSEIQTIQRWVLLTHEIGHAFYDLHFEEFDASVIPQVIRKLVETRPPTMGQQDLENIIRIWTRKWIPELASDCFAVKTIGPPYVIQFLLLALNSRPNHVDGSHPPFNLRVDFMMDALESMALSNFEIDFYRDVWGSYSRSITHPSSRYILQEEVVETALSGIDAIIRETPMRGKWIDILAAKRDLTCGKVPDKDIVSIISATALLEPVIDLGFVYSALSERNSLGSDASQGEGG